MGEPLGFEAISGAGNTDPDPLPTPVPKNENGELVFTPFRTVPDDEVPTSEPFPNVNGRVTTLEEGEVVTPDPEL
jgi:hypothetical protein